MMDLDTSRTYTTPCRIESVMIAASFVVRVVIVVVVVMVPVAMPIVVGVKALLWAGKVVGTSVKVLVVAALTDTFIEGFVRVMITVLACVVIDPGFRCVTPAPIEEFSCWASYSR